MPFKSQNQARAAFAGGIPGFSKDRAKQWADETPGGIGGLPKSVGAAPAAPPRAPASPMDTLAPKKPRGGGFPKLAAMFGGGRK